MKFLLGVTFLVAAVTTSSSWHVIARRRLMPEVAGAPTRESKITNGYTAYRGQFPYQTALFLDYTAFCGGSIISKYWVLTAAHCARNVSSFVIYFGAQQFNVDEPGRIRLTSTVSFVHPRYNPLTVHNDIALVRLPSPVKENDYIQYVALASKFDAADIPGKAATVSGWGRTSDSTNGISPTLQYVDLKVISNLECAKTYGPVITPSTLCAQGADGKNTCNGDSGGPLVVYERNRTLQIGAVSFGSTAGCTTGSPAGFSRVSAFRIWIFVTTALHSPRQ